MTMHMIYLYKVNICLIVMRSYANAGNLREHGSFCFACDMIVGRSAQKNDCLFVDDSDGF